MKKIFFFDESEASEGIVEALEDVTEEGEIVAETYKSGSRGISAAISQPPSAIVIIDEGKGSMVGDMTAGEISGRLGRHMSTSNVPLVRIAKKELREVADAGASYAHRILEQLHNEMKRLLLVTDDDSLKRELSTGLQAFYQMKDAETAIGAGSELLKFIPDLVLVSYALREDPSGGLAFCESLRSDNRFNDLPIVGLGDFPEDKRYCLDTHLDQPFTLEEVHGTIDSLLKKE